MGYQHLFQPGSIGTCGLKNRIVMAPLGNINMADPIGRPLEKMVACFTERAKGGAGLLITGMIPVSPMASTRPSPRITTRPIYRASTVPLGLDPSDGRPPSGRPGSLGNLGGTAWDSTDWPFWS